MPRQLVGVVKTEVSKQRYNAAYARVYGRTYSELARYIIDKYGIRKPYVHAILHDIFRFIEMEVMAGERGIFTVPRFGRFERSKVKGGFLEEEHDAIRFNRAAIRRGGTYIDFEDEEWVDE